MWIAWRIQKGEGNPNHDDLGRFASSMSAGDKVREALSKLPTRNPEENWLIPEQTSRYTNDQREVNLKDMSNLGIKVAEFPWRNIKGEHSYDKTALQDVPTDKIVFSKMQPSVNAEKVAYMADNYHPNPEDFNRNGDLRSADEAPAFFLQPDGTYIPDGNHRTVAAILRGDKSMVGRVTTYKQRPDGFWTQSKAKATYK